MMAGQTESQAVSPVPFGLDALGQGKKLGAECQPRLPGRIQVDFEAESLVLHHQYNDGV
jgi:hypothetical protein